ncbi:VOC family protein [Chloroflexota bacterium]
MQDVSGIALPNNIDHLGVVVRDAKKTANLLSSIWGIGPSPVLQISHNKDTLAVGEPWGAKLIFLNVGPISLEITEPLEGNSFHHRFLKRWGEGIDHMCFRVSNWDETVGKFKERGNKMIMSGIFEGKRWCYFETRSGGIIIEFTDNFGIHN